MEIRDCKTGPGLGITPTPYISNDLIMVASRPKLVVEIKFFCYDGTVV